jgi:hypothetical protein
MANSHVFKVSCDCYQCGSERDQAISSANMDAIEETRQRNIRMDHQATLSPAKVQARAKVKVIVRRKDDQGRIILRSVPKASAAQRHSQRKKRTVYAEVTGTFVGSGRPGKNLGWAAIKV